MWVLIIAVGLVIAGSTALEKDDICEKDSWEICDSGIPFVFPNNEKEFDETCSIILDESKCRQEHAIKCESDKLEKITGIVEFLQEVCRKGSSLNEAIGPNIGCIKENVIKECYEKTGTVFRTYKDYLNTTGEEFSDDNWKKLMCMSLAYDLACAVNAVSVPCGSTVRDAILEVNRRIDWMEKKDMCPRSLREEIVEDIPIIQISLVEKVILEELLLDI
ncbi:uncharacterized protein LOC118185575 [Stegodyphus dumicola]|uniref:uncharacterized protein LOC118185575 n=1 Tax=Stegodyphus dumicola TaxID=202533 RepID=UPI0015A80CEC|nr:uncharacterized protein LOC118185575 [Stegodyphus dumicola]